MDEKTIVVGRIKSNLLARILLISGFVISIYALIYCWNKYSTDEFWYSVGFGHGVYVPYTHPEYGITFFDYLVECLLLHGENLVAVIFYPGILCVLLGILFKFMMSKCAITITDKRVIGNANFGKRVDLPLNQISAVGQGAMSSISIATSSGKINFWFLENRDDVFEGLSDLIKNFQIQKTDFTNIESPILQQTSNADELKKFKELLDSGVITQEEFDAKKKQLLGL